MRMERQEWESTFFGRDIYALIFEPRDLPQPPLGENQNPKQAVSWTQYFANKANKTGNISHPTLIQAKIATTDFDKLTWLQHNGFQRVETEITFSLDVAKISSHLTACKCQIASEADLPALTHLAGSAFPHTRFRPPYFTSAENRNFYAKWIENAVKGDFDDICLQLKQGDKLQGMVSLRVKGETAKIGLLAVAPEFQRQGIGKTLLHAAIQWAKSQQTKRLEITTQMSNLPAIQLYQSLGAKMTESYYWFYWAI